MILKANTSGCLSCLHGPQSDRDEPWHRLSTCVCLEAHLMPRLVHPGRGTDMIRRRFSFGFAIRVVIYLILVALLVIVIMRTLENNVA